jgi:hypothetical protein
MAIHARASASISRLPSAFAAAIIDDPDPTCAAFEAQQK